MRRYGKLAVAVTVLMLLVLIPAWSIGQAQRWSEAQANAWYAKHHGSSAATIFRECDQSVGDVASGYVRSSANRQGVGWAEGLGMNTMRVFLHDLLWSQDSAGFKQRIDTFLTIAEAPHSAGLCAVGFCWEPKSKLGPQHPPIPGVHNSGWVQSPGEPA